ncbi:NAD-dependent epimerase/dehydratase family protein [Rhodanobacter sp. Col0626]|uniref:NAD-dependent epimerase/dehydratase family protein n=1 Tax=Rhodanobacter sp. Col0626 TaxID=3415679 RepID=UPI003CEA2843
MTDTKPKGCCLVTGGAGFIGCSISEQLATHYEQVIAIDNLHPQVHVSGKRPDALHQAVLLVVGDVTSADMWDDVLTKYAPSTVIHLAAETGTGQSLTEGSRHAMVNVVGTARMLDALAERKILPSRMVLSSSRAVYGEGAWQDQNGALTYPGQRSAPMLERGEWDFPGLQSNPFSAQATQARPTSIYGATKLAQENILSSWAQAFDVSLNILRLQNVYGPGQSLTNPYTGIVSLFARLAKAGRSIPLYEDGLMRRDFVFITDVASAIVAAATSNRRNILVDIGSGRSLSIAGLAHIIADIYGAPEPHVTGQYRNGDVRHAACNIEASQATLDWIPRITAEEGIRKLCNWIDERPETLPQL